MNDLTQWSGGGLEPRRSSRGFKNDTKGIVERTRRTGLELDAMAALYGKTIDRTVDLYDHADQLSASRPELRPILMQKVVSFAQCSESQIRANNSPFGF